MGLIENVRILAQQGKIGYTEHAVNQMFDRNVSTESVKSILSDLNNEIIEIQSKSNTAGKEHKNERLLVYSPNSNDDAIIVTVLNNKPTKELLIITVEIVDEKIWNRCDGQNPSLIRK